MDKQLGEYLDISGPVMSPTYENDDIVSWKDESPRGQTGNLISGFPGFSRQGLQSQKAQIGSPAQSRFTSSPLSLGRKARPLLKMNSEVFERHGLVPVPVPATLHSNDAQSNLLTSPLKTNNNSEKFQSITKMDQSFSVSAKPVQQPVKAQVDPLHPDFIEKVTAIFRDVPAEQRTKEHYQECLPFLMTMSYIKKIMEQPPLKVPSEEIVFKIFKSMEYKFVQGGEIIFREREFGSYVYTIMEGTLQVSVMLTRDEQNQTQNPTPPPVVQSNPLDLFKMKKAVPKRLQPGGDEPSVSSNQAGLSQKLTTLGESLMKTQLNPNKKTGGDEQSVKQSLGGAFLGNLGLAVFKRTESQGAVRSIATINWADEKILKSLGPGVTFGEIALTVSTKRTATIVSLSRAGMLMLHRDVFSKIMGKDVEEKKQQYFVLESFFKFLRQNHLSDISSKVENKTFQRGQILINPGEIPKEIFFVRKGAVQLQTTESIQGFLEQNRARMHTFFGKDPLSINTDLKNYTWAFSHGNPKAKVQAYPGMSEMVRLSKLAADSELIPFQTISGCRFFL